MKKSLLILLSIILGLGVIQLVALYMFDNLWFLKITLRYTQYASIGVLILVLLNAWLQHIKFKKYINAFDYLKQNINNPNKLYFVRVNENSMMECSKNEYIKSLIDVGNAYINAKIFSDNKVKSIKAILDELNEMNEDIE